MKKLQLFERLKAFLTLNHKLLLFMKLTVILSFFLVISVSASTYSQNTRMSIDVKNQPIREVLKSIENQSKFRFFYNDEFSDLSKPITLSLNDKTIDEILSVVFDKSDVSYKVLETNFIVITPSTFYQEIKVTGKITDANSEPLPGVNIIEKGTTNGTVTDLNGGYTINVSGPDAILAISFVGYLSKEMPVGNNSVINVVLEEDILRLDEVIVVGYGTQRRADVTGSVTSVPKERLSEIPVTNVMHALEGSTAGLNVTQTSSVPGSSANMQIRGVNSINANTSPFIVLDGIPFFGLTNDINPNDIESIEILKDASAVAIYGTRGANGVILITTKRGSKAQGKPKINYTGYGGVESMAHVLKPMDPATYVQKYADFNKQNNLTQTGVLPNISEIDNYNNGITTDWLDESTQPGRIQEHNISITGGTDNVQYFLSGSHLDQQGVVKGYQYKRTSLRFNLDTKITDYLKVGSSAFVTNNNYDDGRVNFLEANAMSPYSVPYDANGDYIIYPMAPEQLFLNPLLGLSVNRLDRGLNLTGNGYAELTPGFLKGLKYRFNGSYIYNIARTAQYTGRQYNDQSGTAEVTNSQTTNWVVENILSYNIDFGKNHIDVTALYSAQKQDYFRSEALARKFTNDALSYYNQASGASQSDSTKGNGYTLVSQMARVNYSYESKYLLTLTARRDGYSAFGANTDKYGLFPSLALGWNIASEDFMKNIDIIDQLKLRFSYGQTGNMAIGVNQTASTANTVQYPFGGTALTGVLYDNLGNADLHWESTTGTNVGLDYAILKNRIIGTIEVYKTKTKDILLKRNLPNITGYQNVWTNLGKMQNVGIDFTIKTINVKTNSFEWQTNLNFSTYKNKILELYGDGKDDIGNTWFIGEPLHVIYDYEKIGIWQEGEDASTSDPVAIPGDLKFKDQNGDGQITADDKVIIGQKDSKWIGGMTNTFSYKNFTLNIFLQTSHGGLRSNKDLSYADEAWRRNLPADFKYWTSENKDNYWPSLAAYKNYRGFQFAEDYSYVRIKDVTLGYAVPKSFLNKYGIEGLTVYMSGRNLYTFTKWFGWDPEMSYDPRGSGNWRNNYPVVRTISLGINLSL